MSFDHPLNSLGFAKPPSETRVVVAMSGGVDSSVVAAQLAEETGIPLPTVQKLVSKLSAAGLLSSVRGAGGGFRLARPPAAVTLADIIEAVEGPIAMTPCVESGKHDCSLEGSCRVQQHWPQVNDAVRGALANVPLTQLVDRHFVRPEVL